MKIHIKIDCIIGLALIKGTKRFHFYRNEYGVEAGWNVIPRRFGVCAYITRVKERDMEGDEECVVLVVKFT